jgi:intein-encoded DNA endonuclease-like protein
MNKKNQKIDDSKILELYKMGYSTRKIAKILGCGKSTVSYRLHKLGITPRRGLNLNHQEIIKLYKNGHTTTEIAKIMNCSHETIRRILKSNNINIRKSSDSLTIKNTKKINLNPSESLAYILGVLNGDGSVNRQGNNYVIELKVTDKDFVEEFKKHLKCIGFEYINEYVREFKNKKDQYVVRVCSKGFYYWYKNLDMDYYINVIGNNEKLMVSWLKGFYDSEGSVTINKKGNYTYKYVSLSNTDKKLIDICCYYLDKLGINYSIYCEKNSKYRSGFLWRVYIKSNSLETFKKLINFRIERKAKKLI